MNGIQTGPVTVTAPRHASRATREVGRATRAALLEAAAGMFAEHGLGGVSLTEIAAAADAFPSQVTYYFGSKEALFVEGACRDLLRVASAVEAAGHQAATPEAYVRAIVDTAVASPGLLVFVEAMLLARRRPDLAPLVAKTFRRLHAEGERAVAETLVRREWALRASPATEARAFWATVLGVALERAATADDYDAETAAAAVLLVLNFYPEARPQEPEATAGRRRRPAPREIRRTR